MDASEGVDGTKSLSLTPYPPSGDKDKVGGVMFQMLEKKREYYLGSGDLLRYRMWTALASSVMQGLSRADALEVPSSVTTFLALNRFASARDEENKGSGYTPLVCAGMSGNLSVVRGLIESNVDVNARVRVAVNELGAEKGMGALALAAACCPQRTVHNIVALLLEAGADPNSSSVSGASPLIASLSFQNYGGVCALLTCGNLDLEQPISLTNASPLNIAGYLSTLEILKALIEAGANVAHRCAVTSGGDGRDTTAGRVTICFSSFYRNDHGGHIFTDICCNANAQPEWLRYVTAANGTRGDIDVNSRMQPRTPQWKVLGAVFRVMVRLGISRSDLAMEMAHTENTTGAYVSPRCGVALSFVIPNTVCVYNSFSSCVLSLSILCHRTHTTVVLSYYASPPLGRGKRKCDSRALALAQRSPRGDPREEHDGLHPS